MNGKSINVLTFLLTVLLLTLLAACDSRSEGSETLTPTGEEKIKTTVENPFERDPDLPEYVANVKAIVDNWARVSILPVGIENVDGLFVLYVQDQLNASELTLTAALQISQIENNTEVETQSGWAIITQPKAQFTSEELNTAMVSELVRR